MKKRPTSVSVILGCWLVLQSACPFASESGKPAGVVAWACVAGKKLVLLAYDGAPGRNGWASFGGTPRSAAEPVHETASREFHEETGCVFPGPRAEALAAADYSVSGGFYTFVAEVPHLPVSEIEASACGEKDRRSDWVWVDAVDLQRALHQAGNAVPAPGDRGLRLWELARQSMAQAVEDGILDLTHQVCE